MFASSPRYDSVCLAIAALLLAAPPVGAQTTNIFTGASGGYWKTAANWSLGTVPISSDNVFINTNTTVNIDSSSSAGTVTLNGANARFNIIANVPLNATGIEMTGASGNVPIYMDTGTMTLNGGAGSINTSGGVTSFLNINGDCTVNLATANLTYLWLKSGGGAPAQLTITNGQTYNAAVTYLASAPGQSTLNLNGGTLNGGTVIFNGAGGAITNTFNLNSGTLTAVNIRRDADVTNTTFNFNNGTIQNKSGADLNIFRNAGTQNMVISLAGTGTHTFQADSGRTITVASTAVLADKAGEQGTLTKAGAGTLTLANGANSFTGGITINGGTLKASAQYAIPSANSVVVNTGGTLGMGATDTWGNARTTNTVAVTINSGGNMTSDGQFNSLRNLTLNGGSVTLNGGLGSAGAFGFGGTVTVGGAVTSTISASTGSDNYIRLGRQSTTESTAFNVTNAAGQLVVGVQLQDNFGAISGLDKTGDGTLVLAGANGFSGTTTVSGGALVVSNSTFVATILPDSTTVNFASVPSAGDYAVLPGPLAAASLAGKTVTGLGIGQTATLTNAPSLKVIVTTSAPANQKPVIPSGQSFTIAENSPAGTLVGRLSATDADSYPASLSGWTIISGNVGNAFVLNWSTGELTVRGSLNYEATPSYNLTVTVSDGKDTSDPVNVTINLANVAEFSDVFGLAEPAADSNGDGIPNLLAYALGAINSNSLVARPAFALNSSNLTLTALVRTNDPRGQVLGNATTNLTSWPTNSSIVGIPASDQTGALPGVTQRQVFSVDRGSDTQKFLRLQIPVSVAQDTPIQNTASIQAQIDAAVAAGANQVRIQPGVYTNIVPTGINPHLRLANLRDLDIDATGVVLVCSRLSRAIFLRDCTNLTLRGLTIDYSPLPMTQGTITGFGPSREWTDVRIHDGYPAPAALTNGWSFLWTSDAQTRRIKPGTANRPNQSITDMGGGVWRVAHGVPVFDQAAVGDYLRIPQPVVDNSALVANRCSKLTLTNVTIYSAPFHFASSFGWDDGLTLQSCRVVPGSTPAGDTEPRLFSAVGDGFHFETITGGLTILDCETDSTGDDGIAVYDMPLLVGAVADGGRTVTLSFGPAGGTDSRWVKRPKSGTRFRFYVAATGNIEEGLVTNRTSSTMSSQDWTTLRNQLMPTASSALFTEPFVVQLQNAVSASPGDEARMLDDPFETIIRGCRVRNSGSRGIVADTPRVRIENNQIEDTVLPAVHTFACFSQGAPGFQDDVTITNNHITRANLGRSTSSDFLGSICIVNWDTNRANFGGHRRIVIENNEIAESWGVDVQVHAATNVIVRGNRFVDSHGLPAGNGSPRNVDNSAAIFLQTVQTAVIETNQLIRPGPYLGVQPLSTQDVTGLQAGQAFTP